MRQVGLCRKGNKEKRWLRELWLGGAMLLVVVMTCHGDDVDQHYGVVNAIYNPIFLFSLLDQYPA